MTDRDTPGTPQAPSLYRVLARKYRPARFSELIGQEAMVRTLTNAFASGRLAHAFLMTGVRGVGKTTTARILAKALNCVGPDGTGGPTVEPCGACEACRAIAEDRHMDVLEMDAASRTKVEEMRELLDGVRYRPTSARYKVYIVDEVHMLSRHAFNALLKTLEEPPEHVKFIFATTEVRKIPVTVLSRCQRFDLRRVDQDSLARHFAGIAEREGAKLAPTALALIARAADGSVRDGLSLLDQAIAHGAEAGEIGEDDVRRMLGLADRTRAFDLFESVMAGDIRAGLAVLDEEYVAGADPALLIEDLLELAHWLTRVKIAPEAADAPHLPEAERVRGRALAERLTMATLARAWQMLLKGLTELHAAPSPLQSASMILVRLAYAAELPTPAELARAADVGATSPLPVARPAPPLAGPSSPARPPRRGGPTAEARAVEPAPEPPPPTAAPEMPRPDPTSFAAVVDLADERREGLLHAGLVNHIHLVRFEPGRIEFRPAARAPADFANRLSRFLNDQTDRRWVITISQDAGQPTLAEAQAEERAEAKAEAARHPLVKAILETFPGTRIERVGKIAPAAGPADESRDE